MRISASRVSRQVDRAQEDRRCAWVSHHTVFEDEPLSLSFKNAASKRLSGAPPPPGLQDEWDATFP